MGHAGVAGRGTPPGRVSGANDPYRWGESMKRTTATFLMLAGLGGCVSPDKAPDVSGLNKFGQASRGKEVPGAVGPTGKPVLAKGGAKPAATPAKTETAKANLPKPADIPGSGIVQVSATAPAVVSVTKADDAGVQQAAGFSRIIGGHSHTAVAGCSDGGCADGTCDTGTGRRHLGDGVHRLASHIHGGGGGIDPAAYGPMAHGMQIGAGKAGIFPVPSMGPYGAVAAVGAYGAAGGPPGSGPMYANQRTMIRFVSPQGMRITWQTANGAFTDATPLEAPARYNFPQGSIYRLKIAGIPNRPGATYYPTLEVYPATPDTIEFLSHAAVPVGLTDEDFDQVRSGNLVVKVIYLPNRTYQDLAAVAGAEEVVSTRLEPGVDPIVEANRRGTILAVIRVGNIDLQDPNTPPVDAPPGAPPAVNPTAVPGPVPSPPVPADGVRTPAPLPNAVKMPVTANPVSLPAIPVPLGR